MPVKVAILPSRSLVLFQMHGLIDVPQVMDSFLQYIEHPLFDPSYCLLTDTRGITEIQATFLGIVGGVQRSIPLFRQLPSETLSVILAPDDVAFGMSRILQQVAEPLSNLKFEILRDEAQALAKVGQSTLTMDCFYADVSSELAMQ